MSHTPPQIQAVPPGYGPSLTGQGTVSLTAEEFRNIFFTLRFAKETLQRKAEPQTANAIKRLLTKLKATAAGQGLELRGVP